MTSLFDGLSGIVAGIFGDLIEYAPRVGMVRPVASIFRENPIEIIGQDGQTLLIDAPTWRVARNLVPELGRGDVIRVPDGRFFEVQAVHPGGSPALDASVIAELHMRGAP